MRVLLYFQIVFLEISHRFFIDLGASSFWRILRILAFGDFGLASALASLHAAFSSVPLLGGFGAYQYLGGFFMSATWGFSRFVLLDVLMPR